MKIFLTGASGFLGSHTADELVRRGHNVTALVRKMSRRDHLRSEKIFLVEGALPELNSLVPHLEKADAVIHIAGLVKALSPREFHCVNEEGTSTLVDQVLAAKNPKLFLYISSLAAHNPTQDGSDFCLKSELCHPLTHYGRSKLGGELALKKLRGKVKTLILRPPVLYGPGDGELLPLIKAIRFGFAPLFGDGKNRVSFCYIQDVARAIVDLVENPPLGEEIFCLDDGEIHSWHSLASTLAELLNPKARLLTIPSLFFYSSAAFAQVWAQLRRKPLVFTLDKMKEVRQRSWVCGYERLNQAIGWKPQVTLREGFVKTLRYYEEQGLIG